ncbi:hypothetical protein ACWGJT_20945 [Streptomyces xantholiticus]
MGRRWDDTAGRKAVGHLLEGLTPSQVLNFDDPACWTSLDEAVRNLEVYRWDGHDPQISARLRARQETALCHRDGRVREGALAAGPGTPAFWYLLVVRCADWVEPVRVRARRMLAERLQEEPEWTLRALTPLVLRVGRREQGAWARDLFDEALRAAPALALDHLHDTRDTATRRFAARVVLDAGLLDVRELARSAAETPDPVLWRWWSDAALATMAADGPDDEAVDTLLGARAPLVRSAGVTALRRAGRTQEASRYLTDRSSLVRACARWAVSQGGGDPHSRCLALCTDPATVRPPAVAGLAECGRRADAELLRLLMSHPVAAVRAQAVAGLRLLESVPVEDTLLLVDDPSAAVAREAARALLPYARRLPADRLTERLSPPWPTPTRRAAFRLLRACCGLIQLRAAVALLSDADPALRRNAESAVQLRAWMADVPPGDTEVDRLLRQCTHLFSDYVMGVLRARAGLGR